MVQKSSVLGFYFLVMVSNDEVSSLSRFDKVCYGKNGKKSPFSQSDAKKIEIKKLRMLFLVKLDFSDQCKVVEAV